MPIALPFGETWILPAAFSKSQTGTREDFFMAI